MVMIKMYNNPFNISKIINSSVNIINAIKKIMPIYEDIKPLLNKFKTLGKSLNNITLKNDLKVSKNEIKKEEKHTISSSPQFFL